MTINTVQYLKLGVLDTHGCQDLDLKPNSGISHQLRSTLQKFVEGYFEENDTKSKILFLFIYG
jgi:hypothetical protein